MPVLLLFFWPLQQNTCLMQDVNRALVRLHVSIVMVFEYRQTCQTLKTFK